MRKTYILSSGNPIFLFVMGGVFGSILQLSLYLRATPFGLPYVLDTSHYVYHALFYEWYGMALISFPFVIANFLAKAKQNASGRWGFLIASVQIALITASLGFSQLEHEMQRFMGSMLTRYFWDTYGSIEGIPSSIWEAIDKDAGGSYSAIWLFCIPAIYLAVATYFAKVSFSIKIALYRRMDVVIGITAIGFFLVAPSVCRTSLFGGKNRQQKVAPPIIRVVQEFVLRGKERSEFSTIRAKIEEYQRLWQAADDSDRWEFPLKDYPVYRRHKGACEKETKDWNVVLVILETFRSWNIDFINEKHKTDTTPFLRKIAMAKDAAFWPRFFSNGQPTVFSFMSIHTSLLPHSTKTVAKSFMMNRVSSLPEMLKARGYHTVFFTGSDPDWDSQRVWANKWYDYLYFNPENKEIDRLNFRALSRYLKGQEKAKPFLATIMSISNHLPFESPEPHLNVASGSGLRSKINNTMRYTDDVVREFYESVRNEPWFEDTIFIITGDHGYDLGERGVSKGHENIRHETNWVPLIISSRHPLQPVGRQDDVASHIDIAPTVMEMLGYCDSNSFMGHSLLSIKSGQGYALNVKNRNMAFENRQYSAFFPEEGTPVLYKGDDLLQLKDVSSVNSDILNDLRNTSRGLSMVADYIYEKNLALPQ